MECHLYIYLQVLLVPEMGEADIPGIADARLAGWRAGSPSTDGAEASADSTNRAPSAESTPHSGEPECGDVVEVRDKFDNDLVVTTVPLM